MRTIKLLKGWLTHKPDTIIQVDNNVAFGLVDGGVATYDLSFKKVVDERKSTKELGFGKKKRSSYKIK